MGRLVNFKPYFATKNSKVLEDFDPKFPQKKSTQIKNLSQIYQTNTKFSSSAFSFIRVSQLRVTQQFVFLLIIHHEIYYEYDMYNTHAYLNTINNNTQNKTSITFIRL